MKGLLAKICVKKRSSVPPANPSSFLFRPVGTAVGDGVVLTAAFGQVKKLWPSARVGVLVTDRNRSLYARCPWVDELVEDRFSSYLCGHKRWDVFLDYSSSFTTRKLISDWLLAPRYFVSFQKEAKKHYTPQTLRHFDVYCPTPVPETHVNSWLGLTPLVSGAELPAPSYALAAPKPEENPYHGLAFPVLLCVEGTTRRLPPDILAAALTAAAGKPVQWVILNSSHAPEYYARLRQIPGLDVRLAPKGDLNAFLAHVYFAHAVVSIDTATVHLACTWAKPLLAFYTRWARLLRLMGPFEYPGLRLCVSNREAQHTDDYSTFTAEEVTAALSSALDDWLK